MKCFNGLFKKNSLNSFTLENTPDLIKNRNTLAKVLKCYDGDTCTIVFLIDKFPVKLNLRLLEIDTAEIKGNNRTNSEKELSILAKKFLEDKVLNKRVYVELKKWDKYGGRVLGNIYNIDSKNRPIQPSLSQQLLSKKMAHCYDGKTKLHDWDDLWEKYKNDSILNEARKK
jgi:endonuclease YncB( thermonuclease family)